MCQWNPFSNHLILHLWPVSFKWRTLTTVWMDKIFFHLCSASNHAKQIISVSMRLQNRREPELNCPTQDLSEISSMDTLVRLVNYLIKCPGCVAFDAGTPIMRAPTPGEGRVPVTLSKVQNIQPTAPKTDTWPSSRGSGDWVVCRLCVNEKLTWVCFDLCVHRLIWKSRLTQWVALVCFCIYNLLLRALHLNNYFFRVTWVGSFSLKMCGPLVISASQARAGL